MYKLDTLYWYRNCNKPKANKPLSVSDPDDEPVYRRPNESDLMDVGYKATMMLSWQGHLNVESATSERLILDWQGQLISKQ
jgi:hypothetical protein